MLEAYIYDGLRTPFGRHSGALSRVRPDDLLAGVVKEVGPGVTDLKAGDKVILSFVPACMKCKPCQRGQSYLCDDVARVAMSPHFVIDGKPVGGFTGLGTFSEELVISQTCLIKIDADVPLSEMFGYATALRSMSQGRANYTMEFDHYSEVPKNISEDIIGEGGTKGAKS